MPRRNGFTPTPSSSAVQGLALRALAAGTTATLMSGALAQPAAGGFGDPFVAVTHGLPSCRVAQPSTYTAEERRNLAHERAQRGVSCWLDGRCRLSNAYLYDAEIIPRVARAIDYAGQFTDTRLWALGQRRHVWLMGCVARAEQIGQLETLVRRIDDVEGVHLQLVVGTPSQVPYRTGE